MGIGIQILSWENKPEQRYGRGPVCVLAKGMKKRYTEIEPAEPEKNQRNTVLYHEEYHENDSG